MSNAYWVLLTCTVSKAHRVLLTVQWIHDAVNNVHWVLLTVQWVMRTTHGAVSNVHWVLLILLGIAHLFTNDEPQKYFVDVAKCVHGYLP